MQWYIKVLKDFAVFSGRSHRTEFWMFVLFNILVSIALAILENMLGLRTDSGFGVISSLYSLVILLPSIAVSVRRLHDTGRSGLWLLVSFVPVIGGLILLYFFILDSDPGANDHGPNPK